ncbi:5'/3'-nucleotidase SurE [Rhodocyclus tenuis]|uniref:5'-nucleotidase n=1 Tax=Rhodocyclus tenuis TaxID=1066 RepID=A0A840G2N3_RHOTE|nr:5'/3'-nucleotidase SurE [Rhodocyclus tenuis]MBB4248584.1 5'-nucleotidase [Rhodocyclus tenuis]
MKKSLTGAPLARMLLLSVVLLASGLPQQANALDILLTNDDGYAHPNIRALYRELSKAGHRVAIAAPAGDQSARGGAFFYGEEVVAGRDDDSDYPASHYVKTRQGGTCLSDACRGQEVSVEISATPVMAALYGIERVLPHADLVISGPNAGHNLGRINNSSGTFNAAAVALVRGYPAIAVSADYQEASPAAAAAEVVGLVALLESLRGRGDPLLPPGIGLNVNLPRSDRIKGWQLTSIGGWWPYEFSYVDDLGSLRPALAGKFGIGFRRAGPPSAEEVASEGVVVGQGLITVSPFTGLPGTPRSSPREEQTEWLKRLADRLQSESRKAVRSYSYIQ